MNQILFAVSALILLGCQTLRPLSSSEIPLSVLESFNACHGQDGGLVWKYESEDYGGFSAELDWVSKTEGKWIAEFIDPVGRTVLKLNAGHKTIIFSGSVANRMPTIDVEDDFYVLNGTWLGIGANEFPCFLKFTLPRQWLNLPGRWSTEKSKGKLFFEDGSRDIIIHFMKNNNRWIARCVEVKWSNFIWQPDDYKICYRLERNKKKAVMNYADEFIMKWESYE